MTVPLYNTARPKSSSTWTEVLSSGSQDRDQVEAALEIAAAQREVAGADRGREALVEGAREVQGGVHPVPAGSQRELVRAQLARVEEAEQVHAAEVARAQRAVFVRPVFAHMPGVARADLALRREREHVGRAHVGDAVGLDQ